MSFIVTTIDGGRSRYGVLRDARRCLAPVQGDLISKNHQVKQFDSDGAGLVSLDEYVAGFDELLGRGCVHGENGGHC